MSKRGEIRGIAKDTMGFIMEVSKSNYPREFIGMLNADGDIITDVFFLPGTRSSNVNAVIPLWMMPTGLSYVGSVHSHPHPAAERPSEEDLVMFSRTGNCHIITFYPYAADNWRCYNSKGEVRMLEIVERVLEEETW